MMSTGAKLNLARKSDHRSTDGVCPSLAETSAWTFRPDFTIEGLCRRCAPKHRNSRRETAGWDRVDRQEVFVLCWKAGPSPNVGSAKARAGSMNAPGPFNFAVVI